MAKIIKQAFLSSETITVGANPDATDTENNEQQALNNTPLNEAYRNELREQAYQQGFESGIKEGKIREEQQLEQMKKDLEQLLHSIPEAINQCRLALNTEIADIILLITQEYFVEQQQNPKAIQAQINHILNQINNEQSIELYLHPETIRLVQNANIQLETGHLNRLKIKADEHLISGGCIIKTEHGMFDASITTRIERLKEYLIQLKQGKQNDSLG